MYVCVQYLAFMISYVRFQINYILMNTQVFYSFGAKQTRKSHYLINNLWVYSF